MSAVTRVEELASTNGHEVDSKQFAAFLDQSDEISYLKDQFVFPTLGSIPCETIGDPEGNCLYLLGNSLGLKPKAADKYMFEQLENWGKIGAYMHVSGRVPAAYADQPVKDILARLVGARYENEITIMNGLTVNLHLFMLAFYQPKGTKNKILIEDHAFPSDRYAVRSLLRYHGFGEESLILLKPRPGEDCLRTADILSTIEAEKDSLALIVLPGVQYYTGQKFDMKTITKFAKERDLYIGWDLAHAVGNVSLELHNWKADFAVWCSYKYLNSGAGGVGGVFFHRDHHANPPNHLQGWWSNKQDTRFEMRDHIDASIGAESFRLSNPPPWLAALHLASLEIFDKVGMAALLKKQFLLTGYLETLIKHSLQGVLEIVTPSDPEDRGCQLSIRLMSDAGAKVFKYLSEKGVICDQRGDIIRVAPVPMYNTFEDVYRFATLLKKACDCVLADIGNRYKA